MAKGSEVVVPQLITEILIIPSTNKFLARTEHKRESVVLKLSSNCIVLYLTIWGQVSFLSQFIGHWIEPPHAVPDTEATLPKCRRILLDTLLSCLGPLLLYQGSFHCVSACIYGLAFGIWEAQLMIKDRSGWVRHCKWKIIFLCLALKGYEEHRRFKTAFTSRLTSFFFFLKVIHITRASELLCKRSIKPSSFWCHYSPDTFLTLKFMFLSSTSF